MTTVALLGLGRMGQAIGTRLLGSGAQVQAWNRTHGREGDLVAAGAKWIPELPEAVAGAELVCTVLTDGAALQQVAINEGVLFAMGPGATLVDLSTVDVASSAAVAAAADRARCRVPAIPGQRKPGCGLAGNATLLVSGPSELVDSHRDLLAAIGPNIRHVGQAEQARVVKLCINLMLAGMTQLLAEVVVLGEQSGVDRDTLLDALQASVIGSPFLEYKAAALRDVDYSATFTTLDMRKDVTLALGQGAASAVPLPVTQLVGDLLDDAVNTGFGAMDFLSLVPRLQSRAGAPIDIDANATTDQRSQ